MTLTIFETNYKPMQERPLIPLVINSSCSVYGQVKLCDGALLLFSHNSQLHSTYLFCFLSYLQKNPKLPLKINVKITKQNKKKDLEVFPCILTRQWRDQYWTKTTMKKQIKYF